MEEVGRDQTLDEYVGVLRPMHAARRELSDLREERARLARSVSEFTANRVQLSIKKVVGIRGNRVDKREYEDLEIVDVYEGHFGLTLRVKLPEIPRADTLVLGGRQSLTDEELGGSMKPVSIEHAAAEFEVLTREIREREEELEKNRRHLRQANDRRDELEKILLAAVDSSHPVRVIRIESEESQPVVVISYPSDIRIVELEGDGI